MREEFVVEYNFILITLILIISGSRNFREIFFYIIIILLRIVFISLVTIIIEVFGRLFFFFLLIYIINIGRLFIFRDYYFYQILHYRSLFNKLVINVLKIHSINFNNYHY